MLRGEPLIVFMDFVQPNASSGSEAFNMLRLKYMTSAHHDRYIQEWMNLRYKNYAKDGVSAPQAVDNLFTRARDLRAILKAPYNSHILLRDTITRAVQDEHF